MNYNIPYDSQRTLNNPALYSFNINPTIDASIPGMTYATNDPTALCLSGNAYTMKLKGD